MNNVCRGLIYEVHLCVLAFSLYSDICAYYHVAYTIVKIRGFFLVPFASRTFAKMTSGVLSLQNLSVFRVGRNIIFGKVEKQYGGCVNFYHSRFHNPC